MTIDANEVARLISASGFLDEGIAAFAFPYQAGGTIPLYALYRTYGGGQDHLYTANPDEISFAQGQGYVYLGVAAYVFP